MSGLNRHTLSELPRDVLKPQYDLNSTQRGIVHLGPGAFHRAHQAVYTDLAMSAEGGNWKIDGVSLRSKDLRDNIKAQDNLYSLMVLDDSPYVQVIGAFNQIFVLGEQRHQVMEALTDASTHIISLTVTEKGYCLNNKGELDWQNPDIKHDLAHRDIPKSSIGLLVAALEARFIQNKAELTIISCDNLSDNGDKLANAVITFANEISQNLANWIKENICFPNTMVDSITPATDDALKEQTKLKISVNDAWPIQRESFTQWVVEDKFSGPRPAWDKVGVTFTDDVHIYEKAKLRILNGTHSTLAYIGSLVDLETVYEAISISEFEQFIRQLLSQEILPSIDNATGMDLDEYANDIIKRYHNKHIRHFLTQIAWDGSQKIPFRILNTIRDNIKAERSIVLLCVPIAAWCLFLAKRTKEEHEIVDPLAEVLTGLVKKNVDSPLNLVDDILDLTAVFADLSANQKFRNTIKQHVVTLNMVNKSNLAGCLTQLKDGL
ncbi:mannitol dehydrogenase family protein [Aliiglaciecola lipolytica]|uniref:Fructuronate reductase n=1 Tax=Aliiglaciecola lipolytica E3 TaxID=1127673 RepID=K6YCV5_9ALTE|nr:mannitol dehydrogenase family protein [Aliiglaciecola lipolytica]GAC14463.1 fructuronate reductase [Aliiglaciecola lipolytica E3]